MAVEPAKIRRAGGRLRPELLNKFLMYAIVEIAGQQFKVEAGNEIFVHRLADAKGAEVEFTKVLLVANDADVKVGAPYVDGAVVKATVLDDAVKADKVQRSELTKSLKSYGTQERSIKFKERS